VLVEDMEDMENMDSWNTVPKLTVGTVIFDDSVEYKVRNAYMSN
jgi:hypothetical protein